MLSGMLIPDPSCCSPGPARATRCEAGCNIKQHALTLSGRTPATKATTKKLPLTAFPLFAACCVTPAPSWKNVAGTWLWTRCRSLGRGQKQLWPNERRRGHSAPACKSWWKFSSQRSIWRGMLPTVRQLSRERDRKKERERETGEVFCPYPTCELLCSGSWWRHSCRST